MPNANPNFQVGPIDHAELYVPDRNEAAAWYERVLGLKVLQDFAFWAEDPGGPLMISSDGGGTKLALFERRPSDRSVVEDGKTGFYRVAFRVSAVGFITFLDRLESVELEDRNGDRLTRDGWVDHQRSHSIYFRDPYGHLLEVTSYEYDALKEALG